MTVNLSNTQMGILWGIMEKYEAVNTKLADSLNNVILKKNTDEDLMNISQNMDYRDIDEEDSNRLDEILGVSIGVVCFNF